MEREGIPDISKEDLAKILERPQNIAIIQFLKGKDWVLAEEIASKLGINVSLIMLYLSDLEKIGLLERVLDKDGDQKDFKFKVGDVNGLNIDDVLSLKGSDVSEQKIAEAVALYIEIYASLITKLNEIGGRATIVNIIQSGIQDVDENKARSVVSYLKNGGTKESALETFNLDNSTQDVKTDSFVKIKSDFIEMLRKIIEALEKFMGKLYGQHLTKSSIKPLISKNKDLIIELDLLAGLPREYFSVGGA